MIHHPRDTIVALSSAPGPGGRALVRLSGPDAVRVAGALFASPTPLDPSCRGLFAGEVRLAGVGSPLPAELYLWPAPRTYTGQDLVEIHTLSSPPLVEALVAGLLEAGARTARPGEFTLRAFLAGKLDLTRAEAVLGVIEADSPEELRQALAQLAGGVATPLHALREDLLNLLADVEAGLDFTDEDIQFVGADDLLRRLGKALALLTNLARQLERRNLADRPFRVVLAGRPNAGKSSLFNALAEQGPPALVSPRPGTTRDYLIRRLPGGESGIDLIDTAGWQAVGDAIEEQAQELARTQAERADLILLCLPAGEQPTAEERALLAQASPPVLPVATKGDLAAVSGEWLATSAITGAGLSELGEILAARAGERAESALAPSWSRCRHHVGTCLDHLRRAHQTVIEEEPPELLALELREGLHQLGEMVGAVYTDDLLDRIFSRFCIGK